MKKLTVHRELKVSYASCETKNGTPIANSPTSIGFTKPIRNRMYEITTLVKEYIEKNGYDFEKVRDYTYSLWPDELEGNVLDNRKTILDFMQMGADSYSGAKAVVRKRIKDVFDQFPPTRQEYCFKKITIYRKGEKLDDEFYLLISPMIVWSERVYEKSLFYNRYEGCMIRFDSYEEWDNSNTVLYDPVQITLPAKYRDLQVIHLCRNIFVSDGLQKKLLDELYRTYERDRATGYEFGYRLLFDE